jgi:hypothetical protein
MSTYDRGRGKAGRCRVGTVSVRVLIVGTPLVRGALARQEPMGGYGVVGCAVAEACGRMGEGSVVQKFMLRQR